MRKYLLVCLISLVILTLSFVAVSQEKEISILLTGSHLADVMETLQDDFEKETGIKVNVEIVGYEDTHTKGILDLVSGTNNYDLLMVDNPWIAEYVQTGNLLVLDEFMAKEDPEYLAGFDKAVLDAYGLYEGKYYGYPIMLTTTILFYRSDLFEQYGKKAPETWDEFNEIAKFFTQSFNPESPVKYGISIAGERGDGAISQWLPLLWGYGGSVFDKDWNVTLNTPEALKALEAFVESAQYSAPGFGTNYFPEQVAHFTNGEIAMMENWDAFAGDVADPVKNPYAENTAYASIPGKYPLLGGWALSINKNSKDLDSAYTFLRWACGPEVTKKSLEVSISTPIRIDVAQDPEVKAIVPWVDVVYEEFKNIRKYAETYQGGQILIPEAEYHVLLGTAINEALTGQLSAKDALAKAQKDIEDLLKKHGYK